MKTLCLVLLLTPTLALADGPFDGTWRLDLRTAQLSDKPEKMLLQSGTFRCSTCDPPIEVRADGQDHKITGSPYYDTINVRVVNERTIETTSKKGGKVTGSFKESVSADGGTLTTEYMFHPEASSAPVTGRIVRSRTEKGPVGAHAISGSWRNEKVENVSQNILTVTYKSTPDGLSYTSPIGESYDAKFDGKDYPYKGNPGVTSVSLKRIDERTIEETGKRDGQVFYVARITAAPDGKSLSYVVEDKRRNTIDKFTAVKQQ